MAAALKRFGFTEHEVDQMNFKQAKSGMNKCIERVNRGLASIKQRRLLSKFGIDAGKMTFESAGEAITKIARNGWKRPVSMGDE